MIVLKESFADCSACGLIEAPSCIMDTNSKRDLSKVDIVVVAENPGKDEIKKGIPLIGKAGKTYRKYHNKYLKNYKWLLTNCVLCQTLDKDGKTINPSDEVIERCKVNCFNIIEQCNPKLILIMGASPLKAFGIAKGGITNLRGQLTSWKDYDVLITIHPSFVNRQRAYETLFEEDIKMAAEFLSGENNSKNKTFEVPKGKKGIHRYKIPEKYYTNEYRLVDIQFLGKTNEVLYIFRDKDNNKVYHKESDEYICYECPPNFESKKIVPYDELHQLIVSYKSKTMLNPSTTYEGDLRITSKHAMDYYHYNIEEAKRISSNILFLDIEVDTGIDNRTFPSPEEALYQINMITCVYQNPKKTICYVLDNKTEEITNKENVELKIFEKEKSLLLAFIKDLRQYDPDFISGWNAISFDMYYIFNRLKRLRIPQERMSKFGEFFVDPFRFSCKLLGSVVVDQDYLYKMFTFTKKENYKLGFISQEELGVSKIDLPLPFNEMYWKMLNTTIEYNIRDAQLLEQLEDKLKHINLLNELRVVCKSSFEGASSSFGQVDNIMVSFLKDNGLASKNSDPNIEKVEYPGAYVHAPKPGIYDNITDFDFTSLYPSIIMTYNIGVNNYVMKTKDDSIGYDLTYAIDNLPEQIEVIVDPTYSKKSTIIPKKDFLKVIKDDNLIHTINGCFFKPHDKELSVYSQVLKSLLSSRKEYKRKMLDAKEAGDNEAKDFYDTKQLVYKVLANSLYGIIANKAFRFYDNSCAAAITLGGQEALKHSIVEGEEFMKHLHKNIDVKRAIPITKQEMYSDEMPDRIMEYIVTGDTDSIFCCFQDFKCEKSDENIKQMCDQVQSYLNDIIIKEIVEKHNVNIENNKLELKNELIISRGLFLAKKRYAIQVINNEGRKVNEMKYMGIEIKRSDYPSASKEFMKELLDLIMKSPVVRLSILMRFVNKKEKEFIQLIKNGDKTIGRPVSFGKKIEDYKTVPQGVRGMLAFNKIAYNIHQPGARGYLFRVSGIDETKAPKNILENYSKFIGDGNKLETIVIPDEESRLPEYFIPDIKGNLEFVFKDRYKLMLAPLFEVKKNEGLLTLEI